jgi:hypothetical protein
MGDVYMFLRDDRAAEPWYLESLELTAAIEDTWSTFDTRSHLGWGYLSRGEAVRATECFSEALQLAAATGARAYVGQFLHGLAAVAKREGKAARALRLGGAASRIRYGGLARWDPRLTEDTGLPRGAVEKEWTAGSAMSVEEAVRFALEGGDVPAGIA